MKCITCVHAYAIGYANQPGLATMLVAKAYGAARVVVTDLDADRVRDQVEAHITRCTLSC